MNDIHLIDEPVTTKDYKIFDINKLPKVFLGIRVKNKFDEQRLQIKSKYNPILLSHFKTGRDLEPIYMYGTVIKHAGAYASLLQKLNDGSVSDTSTYKSVLSQYNLSCDTCYRYLSDGIYPVDVNHLDSISNTNMSREMSTGFQCMVKKSNHPWYANLLNFNIFILGKSTGYNVDYKVSIGAR